VFFGTIIQGAGPDLWKYPINLSLEAVLRAPASAFAEADPHSDQVQKPPTTGAGEMIWHSRL